MIADLRRRLAGVGGFFCIVFLLGNPVVIKDLQLGIERKTLPLSIEVVLLLFPISPIHGEQRCHAGRGKPSTRDARQIVNPGEDAILRQALHEAQVESCRADAPAGKRETNRRALVRGQLQQYLGVHRQGALFELARGLLSALLDLLILFFEHLAELRRIALLLLEPLLDPEYPLLELLDLLVVKAVVALVQQPFVYSGQSLS